MRSFFQCDFNCLCSLYHLKMLLYHLKMTLISFFIFLNKTYCEEISKKIPPLSHGLSALGMSCYNAYLHILSYVHEKLHWNPLKDLGGEVVTSNVDRGRRGWFLCTPKLCLQDDKKKIQFETFLQQDPWNVEHVLQRQIGTIWKFNQKRSWNWL